MISRMNWTPDFFRFFFDSDMKDLTQNNCDFNFKEGELEQFVAIFLLTGYNKRPQQYLYWSTDEDTECQIVRKHMSRSRFRETQRFIHVAKNDKLTKGDKMAKINPTYTTRSTKP